MTKRTLQNHLEILESMCVSLETAQEEANNALDELSSIRKCSFEGKDELKEQLEKAINELGFAMEYVESAISEVEDQLA